jgi:hypothetical protein
MRAEENFACCLKSRLTQAAGQLDVSSRNGGAAERFVADRIVGSCRDFGNRRASPYPGGRAKNAPEVRYASLVHLGGGQLLATAAAGVGNACTLSFREAPRLGRQARGKRACRTIALRHDER